MYKRIILSLLVLAIVIVTNAKCTFADDTIVIGENAYSIDIEETDEIVTVDVEIDNGENATAVLDKTSGELYVDGDLVDYEIENEVQSVNLIEQCEPTSNGSNWTPVLVQKNLKISCKPLFKSAAYVISALIAVMGQVAVTYFKKSNITLLVTTVLSSFSKDATEKINLTYLYDWYRTKGAVLLEGATVKTIANRYQNYSVKATFKSKTIKETTQKKGAWWSGTKPF